MLAPFPIYECVFYHMVCVFYPVVCVWFVVKWVACPKYE